MAPPPLFPVPSTMCRWRLGLSAGGSGKREPGGGGGVQLTAGSDEYRRKIHVDTILAVDYMHGKHVNLAAHEHRTYCGDMHMSSYRA